MPIDHSHPDFPFTPTDPGEPPVEFAELRATRPVARVRLPSGDTAWLVTRHADVRAVLADTRLSRAAATAPGAPRLGPARPDSRSMMAMDPPDHTRLRRLVTPAFTRQRVEPLRARISELAARLLDTMAAHGQPADLVAHYSRPLAMAVICDVLDVPEADRGDFDDWTTRALSLAAGAGEDVAAARDSLRHYLAELVRSTLDSPGDGLLGTLAKGTAEGWLSPAELLEIGSTILTAGYHTVRTSITNSVLVLLRHPDQLARLRRRPDLLPTAVEELLRFTPGPVSGGTIRIATEDIDIGGQRVRKGEAVLPAITSANRDEAAFERAAGLDLTRTENPHIAFGPGIHHCLGVHLARIELTEALRALLGRFPGLRLAAPVEELAWQHGGMLGGLTTLPLAW